MLHTLRFSLQNAVYFIIPHFLVLVLFTFYIQGVLKFKCKTPVPNVNEINCFVRCVVDPCVIVPFIQKNSSRCNKVSNFFYYSIFIWSLICFGRHTAYHQESKTCTGNLGFFIRGRLFVRVVGGYYQAQCTWQRPFHLVFTSSLLGPIIFLTTFTTHVKFTLFPSREIPNVTPIYNTKKYFSIFFLFSFFYFFNRFFCTESIYRV
jgi:hypothetical protein